MNSIVKKNKELSLNKNFIYNFINQVLLLIVPVITTPYLARVLGVEMNGRISFASSVISYFVLFANYGFNTYGQREIAKCQNNKEKENSIFWSITLMKASFTSLALIILFSMTLGNVFASKYKTFILFQSFLVANCTFDVSFFFQGIEDFKSTTIRSIILRVVGMICIFSFVKKQDDAWIYVLSNSLTAILSSILMWPIIIKRVGFVKKSNVHFRRHLKPATLIFLPMIAVTIYSVFDKTMIGMLAPNPDYANGNYEQAYKLNSIILLLVTVISPVMGTRNAHDYKDGNIIEMKRHLYMASRYVWMISLPLVCGVAVLAKNLSSWFLGSGYDEVSVLLSIMSIRFVCSGFSEIFSTQLFIPIGKEKYCTIVSSIAAVINFSLNIFFIKQWGAIGAAITTSIVEFMTVVIYAFIADNHGYLSIKRVISMTPKYIIASLVMLLALLFMNRYLAYGIWTFLFEVIIGGSIYFLTLAFLKDKFFLYVFSKVKRYLKKALHIK